MLIKIMLSIFVICFISFVGNLCYSLGVDDYSNEKLFIKLGIASIISLGLVILSVIWIVV